MRTSFFSFTILESGITGEGLGGYSAYSGFKVVVGRKVDLITERAAEAAAFNVLRGGKVGGHGDSKDEASCLAGKPYESGSSSCWR